MNIRYAADGASGGFTGYSALASAAIKKGPLAAGPTYRTSCCNYFFVVPLPLDGLVVLGTAEPVLGGGLLPGVVPAPTDWVR